MTNLVLVTIDSLRADVTGSDITPVLEDLAVRGVRFRNAFSNGYSTPVAFPAIQTGTYPDHYGGTDYMSDRRPFLARELNETGFHTAGFHSNPHLRAENNYDTGYDAYNDFDEQDDTLSSIRYYLSRNLDNYSWLYKTLRRVYHTFRTASGGADYTKAPDINKQAFSWLDNRTGEDPFFLWVHYMDVHYPFYPPDRFVEAAGHDPITTSRAVSLNGKMQESPAELTEADVSDLKVLYEGDVRYTDHHLGELISGIEARGFENTAFVVTSDHGELFGDHDIFGHPPSAQDESLHVPLVMNGPGLPAGETVDEMAALIDLPPTIAAYLEVDPADQWVGRSLPPVGETAERPLVLGNETVLVCRTPEWRLVRIDTEDGDVDWELWDLDQGAKVDTTAHQEVVSTLRPHIEEYLEGIEATAETLPEVETDEGVEDRLEALGYK